MLLRALLQTSLVLWLAQQTLQGGVRPQNVAYGGVLPARGVGIGVKPGATGALGAVGSRYGTKAMKTGIGHYPGAHLGVGGYRSLGLGGRGGLRQGGYGGYGASLGTGMGLGMGLGLGQAGKRVYGAGLGQQLPGYGAFPGIGYQGVRPGVSPADLGGPEGASLAQAARDLEREKSRAVDQLLGEQERPLGAGLGRGSQLGPTAPRIHARIEVQRPNPDIMSSNLRPTFPGDSNPGVSALQRQERYEPGGFARWGTTGHEAMLAGAGISRKLPGDEDLKSLDPHSSPLHRPRDPSIGGHQDGTDCVPADLSELLGMNPLDGKAGKRLRCRNLPARGQDVRTSGFSTAQRQAGIDSLPGPENRRDVRGPLAQDKTGLKDGFQRYHPLIPGAGRTQSLGATLTGEGQEVGRLTVEDARGLSEDKHVSRKSKPLRMPEQTERNAEAASYMGGAGNYLGASLGPAGYGTGLGQGAYLGGAAGKLGAAAALGQGAYPQGVAGKSNGYGDGVTGYLGAMAGNGFGYGNGYGDGYGAGLGYPADLADGAESKAGKIEALSTGGYAGQVQGGYGVKSAGGKYGGAAQVPYGNAPVVPAGLEGYGAQLGASQDALVEETGKYDGVNAALGNGYKG